MLSQWLKSLKQGIAVNPSLFDRIHIVASVLTFRSWCETGELSGRIVPKLLISNLQGYVEYCK
jgi:hypothetical protein